MLWPKGSGTEEAPIHLGAYGQGALPVIEGGTQSAGLQLYNQQFWEMENLEVVGGSPYGVHIGGTLPVMRHFRVRNLVVHDVKGEPLSKSSGLVVIAPDNKTKAVADDVIVDGVTAYGTTQWAGIIVNGAGSESGDIHSHGEHIEVRNSIVHDVGGDGILVELVTHGLLEHNVAWNTGMQETETIGTPDGIWEWRCTDCRVAYNEGFFTDSPGVDGGVFDIDFGNENNLVEYNFGHDSQGYCVSIFGAEGQSGNSVESKVRHNTCIHNGRSPRLARRQGAIFLDTWKGGKLDGVIVEDNTVLWEPPLDAAAIQAKAEFTGGLPNRIEGNTIMAMSGSFVSSVTTIQFANNRYCSPMHGEGQVDAERKTYADSSERDKSHAETNETGTKTEPLCDCLKKLIADNDRTTSRPQNGTGNQGHWMLLTDMVSEDDAEADTSRGNLVLIESMMHQFGDKGLRSTVLAAKSMDQEAVQRRKADWNFDAAISVEWAKAERMRRSYRMFPSELLLLSPAGEVAARWQYPIAPADVWLQIQSHLGTPAGMQQMPDCKIATAQ